MVKVTFEFETAEEAQALLGKVIRGKDAEPIPKANKKKKVEEEEIPEDEVEEVSDNEDLGESDNSGDDDDGIDGDTSDEVNDGPTFAQVLQAFKVFTNKKHKGNKKPAFEILKKFKAKSPNDLDEKHYEKVLQLLKK